MISLRTDTGYPASLVKAVGDRIKGYFTQSPKPSPGREEVDKQPSLREDRLLVLLNNSDDALYELASRILDPVEEYIVKQANADAFFAALLTGEHGKVMHFASGKDGKPLTDIVPATQLDLPVIHAGTPIAVMCEFAGGGPRLRRDLANPTPVSVGDTIHVTPLLSLQ